MFIDTERHPKISAPEERNVVSEDTHEQHSALWRENSIESVDYDISSLRDRW
jgi:hypothetical protein